VDNSDTFLLKLLHVYEIGETLNFKFEFCNLGLPLFSCYDNKGASVFFTVTATVNRFYRFESVEHGINTSSIGLNG